MPVLADWAGLRLTDDPSASLAQRWDDRTAQLQAILDDPDVASRPVHEGPFTGQPVA